MPSKNRVLLTSSPNKTKIKGSEKAILHTTKEIHTTRE